MIYISHPYTGNEEENLKDAERIATELAKKHPDGVFINPIATMRHEALAGSDYFTILQKDLILLDNCKAVIFCEGWQQSKGCMCEYGYAKAKGLILYNGIEAFNKEHW